MNIWNLNSLTDSQDMCDMKIHIKLVYGRKREIYK